ncbi:MAG: twin-arginine translocase subunit TatC [Haloarculaceae archaeon]
MGDGEPANADDAFDAGPPGDEPSGFDAPPGPLDNEPTAGAPDDEEMPLSDHIEEMVRRLGIVLVAMALVSGVVFPLADQLINFLWYTFLPGSFAQCPTTTATAQVACPRLYHPLALVLARLKVATLVGFVVALPVFVYQTYRFMRPGLYPRERRYYLASVPTSLVLAGLGVAFAFYLVLPVLFGYFTGYTTGAADVAFGLTDTFDLIVLVLGFFALIFQIPLLVMLAVMMGLTDRKWLADRRLYFWGGFLTVAFIFSPDPTGMAPFLVAATMVGLFEGTLLVLRWLERDSLVPSPAAMAATRPYVWVLAALVGYLASTAPIPSGYYGNLPPLVTRALIDANLVRATPLLVAGGLVALFEGGALLYRRTAAGYRAGASAGSGEPVDTVAGPGDRTAGRSAVGRAITRLRIPVWALALVVGYFGSPDPALLDVARSVSLPPVQAGAVAVGLAVLFEIAIVLARWRRD